MMVSVIVKMPQILNNMQPRMPLASDGSLSEHVEGYYFSLFNACLLFC